MIDEWAPPTYPADALKEKVGGRVMLRIMVDAEGKVSTGRVLEANDARLGEAALAAVKRWTFLPALSGGKKVPCSMDVPVIFDAEKGAKSWKKSLLPPMGQLPMVSAGSRAEPKTTPPGEYPATLRARKLPGWARFSCGVTVEGRVTEPRILGVSHGDFVQPALAALTRWEFTPAKQGDLAVAAEMSGTVEFDDLSSKRGDVLRLNGLTGPDGGEPSAYPEISYVADAVWPHAALLKGEGGEAVVDFLVADDGSVTELKLVSASAKEFGHSALAAMEPWQFTAAIADGRRVRVPLRRKVVFTPVPADTTDALVRAAREDKIDEARGLDEKLTPLFRMSPIYPAALTEAGKPAGAAEIEFVIARDGRARLPRIVSATHEEFGWAAATAIAQWVFKAPLRGGQPVDVKVRIPMQFSAPP